MDHRFLDLKSEIQENNLHLMNDVSINHSLCVSEFQVLGVVQKKK